MKTTNRSKEVSRIEACKIQLIRPKKAKNYWSGSSFKKVITDIETDLKGLVNTATASYFVSSNKADLMIQYDIQYKIPERDLFYRGLQVRPSIWIMWSNNMRFAPHFYTGLRIGTGPEALWMTTHKHGSGKRTCSMPPSYLAKVITEQREYALNSGVEKALRIKNTNKVLREPNLNRLTLWAADIKAIGWSRIKFLWNWYSREEENRFGASPIEYAQKLGQEIKKGDIINYPKHMEILTDLIIGQIEIL